MRTPAQRRKPIKKETSSARRLEIIKAATWVFHEKGYQATTMRDIAESASILGGSLYHHFKSKDALFAEAHGLALEHAEAEILEAVGRYTDPWDRLEAACTKQLEIQVAPRSPILRLMNDLPALNSELRAVVIAQRDRFESIYRVFVADLALDERIDRTLYRIFILSLLNTAATWYRPGRASPAEVSAQMMLLLRREAASA